MTVASTSVQPAPTPSSLRTVLAERGDALSRMRWVARRYVAWLVPLLLNCVTVAVLATADHRGEQAYHAEALVVATELKVPPEQLPRLGQSTFSAPTVSVKVAARVQRIPDLGSLIPQHVTMDPVPGSIVFRVGARAEDARSAALLANTAADVFVEELQRAGAGVGRFAVQSRAPEPHETAKPALSFPKALAVALFAGMLLATGLVGALLRLRRPVLQPSEVTEVTGVPVIGILPVTRRLLSGHTDSAAEELMRSRQVEALGRRLTRLGVDSVVLHGDERSLPVSRLIAVALGRTCPGAVVVVAQDAGSVDPHGTWLLVVPEGTAGPRLLALLRAAEGPVAGAVFLDPDGRPARSGRSAPAEVSS